MKERFCIESIWAKKSNQLYFSSFFFFLLSKKKKHFLRLPNQSNNCILNLLDFEVKEENLFTLYSHFQKKKKKNEVDEREN